MGMHCPITGVNIPRFLIMSIVGFLFLFGYDYLVHHVLLMDVYEQTTNLWCSPDTMQDFFPLMLARQDWPGAGLATNADKPLFVQGIVGHLGYPDLIPYLF